MVTVTLAKLGSVTGVHDAENNVSKFLGIPYGSVSRRWTRAKPLTSFVNGKHDGTTFGPICTQPIMPEMPTITQMQVPSYPPNPDVRMDEFECLNLNIVRPEGVSGKQLPVMVFIHGGAFSVGSSSELIYNGVNLVKTSAKDEMPIIYASINYRLGYFGFMASHKLLEENGGKAVGNYGLWDQRLALEFIKTNISAFGGDANSITIFGESAGAASVHAHLLAGKELMSQAICQSGVLRSIGPLKIDSHFMNGAYETLATETGHGATADLETMRAIPQEVITTFMSKIFEGTLAVCFIFDDTDYKDGFFPRDTDWVSVPSFCKKFMAGDCMTEGIIVAQSIARIQPADVGKLLFQVNKLPSAYMAKLGLESPDRLQDEAGPPVFLRLVQLVTDTCFSGTTEAVIQGSKAQSTYVYRMDRPNKWATTPPFGGLAHHMIELLYLGGVPQMIPTSEAQIDSKLSQIIVSQWLKFANGEEPWTSREKGIEMVYGADGTAVEMAHSDISTRDFAKLHHIVENPDAALTINVALASGTVV